MGDKIKITMMSTRFTAHTKLGPLYIDTPPRVNEDGSWIAHLYEDKCPKLDGLSRAAYLVQAKQNGSTVDHIIVMKNPDGSLCSPNTDSTEVLSELNDIINVQIKYTHDILVRHEKYGNEHPFRCDMCGKLRNGNMSRNLRNGVTTCGECLNEL